MSELLKSKELAARLGVSTWYIYAMRRSGFIMPGGSATIEEAREWLRARPGWNSKRIWAKRTKIREL